jgi:hypothetical protein
MNIHSDPDLFDFEAWSRLAATDPQGFEAARAEAVAALIDSAPESCRQRLEGLQWRINHVREQSNSPVAACIKLSQMMWDRVLGDNGLVENIERLSTPGTARPPAELAEVIALVPRAMRGGD